MSAHPPARTPGCALGLARWAADLGRDLQRAILAAHGPEALWTADAPGLARLLRIGHSEATALVATRQALRPADVVAGLAAQGIGHVAYGDEGWPTGLDDLHDPPVGLFGRGDLPAVLERLRSGPVVAVVGSRRATAQGRAFAHRLAGDLARAGAVVVSGLAHGIDAAAHEGVLDAGGVTVAVLGCGVDVAYPRRHRALAGRIVASGALLSEFWPGTPPAPWRFPARNRIVAGLSGAVAVVEAGERSGALITADFALDLGRPVLAVPGWPGTVASTGCNNLLRAGAALLEHAGDVVGELPGAWRPAAGDGSAAAMPDGLAGRVYECLAREPLPADLVADRVREDAAAVASARALLEEEELAVRGEGQRYWAAPAPR